LVIFSTDGAGDLIVALQHGQNGIAADIVSDRRSSAAKDLDRFGPPAVRSWCGSTGVDR
jgi:hypothetical protein